MEPKNPHNGDPYDTANAPSGKEAGVYTRSFSELTLRNFGNASLTLELNLSTFGHIHGLLWF